MSNPLEHLSALEHHRQKVNQWIVRKKWDKSLFHLARLENEIEELRGHLKDLRKGKKMGKLIGDHKIPPEMLEILDNQRKERTRWAVYQNHDIGHRDVGHIRYLAIGPNNSLQEAPSKMPDTKGIIGWRYIFIGWVDEEKGVIVEEST